jgi:hypothetical protein
MKTCVVLDSNGWRCRKRVTAQGAYHGDSELYDGFNGKPTWVKIGVCREHAEALDFVPRRQKPKRGKPARRTA